MNVWDSWKTKEIKGPKRGNPSKSKSSESS